MGGFYLITAIGLIGLLAWASFKRTPPGGWAVIGTFFGVGSLTFCMLSLPALTVGGALAVAIAACARRGWKVRSWRCFGWGMAGLTTLAAADAAIFYQTNHRPFRVWLAEAREQYPPIPRDDRLRQPAPNPLGQIEPHPGLPTW